MFLLDEDGHDHRKPWRWKPTSEKLLDLVETKMLQGTFQLECVLCVELCLLCTA